MSLLPQTAFWGSAAVLFYIYAGYPLHVFLRSRLRPRPARPGGDLPRLTIIVPAHNEEANIVKKMADTAALDYPADRWEALIASDGSDDGTNELVAACGDPRFRLLALPRRGKNETLNAAAAQAQGEILLFTDADSMVSPDAPRRMVRWFADPGVGGVAGNFVYRGRGDRNQGERAYWDFDRVMKGWQSRAGSVTSATGQLYAIRRSCFRAIPGGVADDFFVSTQVVASGFRLLFEPEAVAESPCAGTADREFRRKVRMFSIGLRGVWAVRALCNPLRHGFYAVQLVVQKVLRRLVFVPLAGLLAGSIPPALGGQRFFVLAAALQAGVYSLGAVGFLLRRTRWGPIRLFSLPCFFILTNAAVVAALFNIVRNRQGDLWSPQRET